MAREDGARRRHRYQNVDEDPSLEPERVRSDGSPELQEVRRQGRAVMPLVGLGVIIAVVLAIGFGGRAADNLAGYFTRPSVGPTPIAWSSLAADASPRSSAYGGAPGGVAPCFAETMPASQRWIDTDRWPTSVVVVTNDAKTPCFLIGQPSVSLNYEDDTFLTTDQYDPAGPPVVLQPTEKAAVRITFADICRSLAKPLSINVTMGLRTTTLSLPQPPGYASRCGSYPPGNPAGYRVSAYEKWPSPPLADLPPVRVDLASFQSYVTPGERLVYSIDVTNISGHTISLYPCPGYRQYLVGVQVHEPVAYRLNCEAVGGRLEVNQTVRFEMEFEVPPETPVGSTTFIWESLGGFAGRMGTPIAVNAP